VVEGILNELEDVSFQRLTAHDVVRHKLVGEIVAAYEDYDARQPRITPSRPSAGDETR